jgi:hypothetical protein
MIHVLIHDREKGNNAPSPKTFYKHDVDLFTKLNSEGWGVYFAVNDFEATEEEMKKAGKFTARNIEFLKKINYVFADLDIAKAFDGQTREQKEIKKESLMYALFEICPPTKVIDTSNGLQPLWEVKDVGIDQESQKRYVNIINSIIAWSKTKGAAGDKVKDVTRILRAPGYYHMKEDPYLCKFIAEESFIYTLEELEKIFLQYLPKEQISKKPTLFKHYAQSVVINEIDRLDIQDLMARALAYVGRTAEFDKQGRIIIDGRLTGNFQGKTGNKDFIGSTSHEDLSGNRITAISKVLGVTYQESFQWIKTQYGLSERVLEAKKKVDSLVVSETKKLTKYYTWGTKELTENFAPIKKETYAIVGGGYGVGKTPFCINMALENVKLGHKVLYLSLEMSTEEIFDFLARKAALWTIPEEIYDIVPERKQEVYNAKIEELKSLKGFVLQGVAKGTDVTWEMVVELLKGDWDLIIVDNFNLILPESGVNPFEHQGRLSSKFLNYTTQNHVPIIVVHHYSKGGAQAKEKTGYSLSGNSKIMNDAQRIILLERKKFKEDETPTVKDKAILKVTLDKGRAYDNGISKIIYFWKGGFTDEFQGVEGENFKGLWYDENLKI